MSRERGEYSRGRRISRALRYLPALYRATASEYQASAVLPELSKRCRALASSEGFFFFSCFASLRSCFDCFFVGEAPAGGCSGGVDGLPLPDGWARADAAPSTHAAARRNPQAGRRTV